MELEDLALYRAVVLSGSITQAAQRFGLTQPSASRRIQRLEQELGGALLDRAGWPLRPTPLGQEVFAFAGAVIDQWGRLRRQAAVVTDLRGELTVATSSAPSAGPAARWVAHFVHRHPRVRVHLHNLGSRAVERMVAEQRAGVGFVGCPPAQARLRAVGVAKDRIRLLVPAHAPYREWPATIPPAWLAQVPVVERDSDSATWAVVRERLGEHGLTLGEATVTVDSGEAVMAAVAAGAGVSFVSEAVLKRYRNARVRALDLEGIPLERTLYLIYEPAVVAREPVAGTFVDFVTARVDRWHLR